MTTQAASPKTYHRQIALHFLLFVVLLLGAVSMPRGPFVLVMTDPRFPPDHMLDVIGKADGVFVTGGALPWLAVAYSGTGNFPDRLRHAGALLVLNHVLAVGCAAGV